MVLFIVDNHAIRRNFTSKLFALFSSAMDRQIDESLRIKHSMATVMNSGSEWRMDPIPRARVEKLTRK